MLCQRGGMVRAEHLAAELQRLGQKRFGFAMPTQVLI